MILFGLAVISLAVLAVLWTVIFNAYKRNLTAKQLAEHQLEVERVKSIQASKMSTLGEMAGGIAHEINNPLAIINGYAGQIIGRIDSEKATFEFVKTQCEKITRTVDRIARIVQGLRTFARDGNNDPFETTEANRIVDEAIEMSAARFKQKGIVLTFKKGDDSRLQCRQVQISQVVLNILNNAYDAVEGLPEKWVEVETVKYPAHIDILITDSGKGIPKEIADKILEPFFTTKPIGKGTGLGLSIAAGIIRSHNGRLYVEGHCPNTRFVISLPLIHAETAAPAAEKKTA